MRQTITDPEILDRLVVDKTPLPNERIDTLKDVVKESCMKDDIQPVMDFCEAEIQKGRAEIVAGLLSLIMAHPKPALTCECLAFATGLPVIEGRSEADVARMHGVSRSAVCQRVRVLRKQLGLIATEE